MAIDVGAIFGHAFLLPYGDLRSFCANYAVCNFCVSVLHPNCIFFSSSSFLLNRAWKSQKSMYTLNDMRDPFVVESTRRSFLEVFYRDCVLFIGAF